MKQSTAVIFSAFLLTTIAVYLLGYVSFIPPWAVFIAWACFFHLGGGINRVQAFFTTLRHIGIGIFAGWLSALLLLNNPFDMPLAAELFTPVMIGIVIAILAKLSMHIRFSVMPAIIYGYASIFAYLNTPALFNMEKLLSISFQNALITVSVSATLGALAGYLNAGLVANLLKLTQFFGKSEKISQTLPNN